MSDSQGGKANEHGARSRDSVAGILLAHGFEEIGPIKSDPSKDNLAQFERLRLSDLRRPEAVFAVDVPLCYSIYGFVYKANFVIRGKGWPEPLALMCRAQHSSGSVIEKLNFLYVNLRLKSPCRSLVMLDLKVSTGKRLNDFEVDGLSPQLVDAVLRYADEECLASGGRIARIFHGFTELRCWLTEGCPFPPSPEQQFLSQACDLAR